MVELRLNSPDRYQSPNATVAFLSAPHVSTIESENSKSDEEIHANSETSGDDANDLHGTMKAECKRPNPDFQTWADAPVTNSLPEWHVNAARQLGEPSEIEMPYRQRVSRQTGQEYESDPEKESKAAARVTHGKGGHLFVPRTTHLQSTRIQPEVYEELHGRARFNGKPFWSDQDFRWMQDLSVDGRVFQGELEGRKWAVSRPGIWFTRPTHHVQASTLTEAEIQAYVEARVQGARKVQGIDDNIPQKELFATVRSDFNVLGGKGEYHNSTGAHEFIGPSKDWRDPDRRFQVSEKVLLDTIKGPRFWLNIEAQENKSHQLRDHGLLRGGDEYGPIPLDENGDAVRGHDKEAQLARQAIQSFVYDPSEYELDAEFDPLIWECSGVGKKGGIGNLKVAITRRSKVKTSSITLVEATRLCEEADWKKAEKSDTKKRANEKQSSKSESSPASGLEYNSDENVGSIWSPQKTIASTEDDLKGNRPYIFTSLLQPPVGDSIPQTRPDSSSVLKSRSSVSPAGATNPIQEAELIYHHTEALEGLKSLAGPSAQPQSELFDDSLSNTSLSANQRMGLLLQDFRFKELRRSRQADL